MINEFEYDKELGIKLIEKFLLPRGYKRADDFDSNISWYKIVEAEDDEEEVNDSLCLCQVIDFYLNAKLECNTEFGGLWVKSYEFNDPADEIDAFIELIKKAKKEVSKDIDELFEFLQDKLVEKVPDDIYTVSYYYKDFGCFDENGLPGVDTYMENTFESFEDALAEAYTCISFDDNNVEIYKGNKNITNEVLTKEENFKKFYNSDRLKESDFENMHYMDAWEYICELF